LAVRAGQCYMQAEDAPPGFWQWPRDRTVLVDGVEIGSGVATRFFQTVDPYPSEWGRLHWRIQLNTLVSGRAVLPMFRTFYSGVEWNLKSPERRWFLTGWFAWEGPGPEHREPTLPAPASIEGETALFRIAWLPKPGNNPIFLRSRVDARDRRLISEALESRNGHKAPAQRGLIVLDDIIKGP
jgi:hypothetical protein